MNESNWREVKLQVLLNKLRSLDIASDQLNDFPVAFDDKHLGDLLFGEFTSSEANNFESQNTKVFAIRNVCDVLAGIDPDLIRRGTVPGIRYNSDGTKGTVTVNMKEPWIAQFGITVSDFENGTERFLKTHGVKKILGFGNDKRVYTLFSTGKPMAPYSMRVGHGRGVYLYFRDAVECYRDTGQPVMQSDVKFSVV